jgi:DNA-binding CsgD family transcriptional regulator
MPQRIARVEAHPENLRLTLHWKNGTTTVKDMRKDIARRAILAALSAPHVFRRVRVLDDGYSIGWPGTAIDFAADALWLEAHPRERIFPDEVMTPVEFKRWMHAYGLSLATAADLLGLSRRTVAYYASGGRRIPRVVFLACMALLAGARRKSPLAA